MCKVSKSSSVLLTLASHFFSHVMHLLCVYNLQIYVLTTKRRLSLKHLFFIYSFKQVSIRFYDNFSNNGAFSLCSGAVIHPMFILSNRQFNKNNDIIKRKIRVSFSHFFDYFFVYSHNSDRTLYSHSYPFTANKVRRKDERKKYERTYEEKMIWFLFLAALCLPAQFM